MHYYLKYLGGFVSLYFLLLFLFSSNSILAMVPNTLKLTTQQDKEYRTNNGAQDIWTAQMQKALQAYDDAQARNNKMRQVLYKLVENKGSLSLPIADGASTPLLEIARIITMGYEINQNFSQFDLRLLKGILDLKRTTNQSFLPGEGTQALNIFVNNVYGMTRIQTVYLMLQYGCPDLETETCNPLLSLIKHCLVVLPDRNTYELVKILVKCGASLDKEIADPKLHEVKYIEGSKLEKKMKDIINSSIMNWLSDAEKIYEI